MRNSRKRKETLVKKKEGFVKQKEVGFSLSTLTRSKFEIAREAEILDL